MDQIMAVLGTDFLQTPVWMWGVFLSIVLVLLVLDLGVFNRKDHEIGVRESLRMSAFYIGIGLLFGGWLWWSYDQQKAVEYLTGFVVEKTLAMDNIFVIAMIFGYFRIPRLYQHRVLFWGILGVIVLRGIMIGVGAALVHEFEWILYLFGGFLIITGIKMGLSKQEDEAEEFEMRESRILAFITKHFRVTTELHGNHFFVRLPSKRSGKPVLYLTPLFTALVMVEIADVIFAVDSVPAIFTVTTDTYIVYTSNIFAILGLRALYFALAALLSRFVYLHYALAVMLVFIGSKIFITDMFGLMHIPAGMSLAVTVTILATGIGLSLWKTRNNPPLTDREQG